MCRFIWEEEKRKREGDGVRTERIAWGLAGSGRLSGVQQARECQHVLGTILRGILSRWML